MFTFPGEVIVDPFNGAGTSTLVAEQMNRRYIGIELSPDYHETALARHEGIELGRDPFGKNTDTPTAKNSRVDRVKKQKYEVSKKALQLDIRRIAKELDRMPTRDEVRSLTQFPFEYFETYFISWGEACAAARTTGMVETPPDDNDRPMFSLFPM
jgi:site-specific DNA-methyltransferase (adenine-specific)